MVSSAATVTVSTIMATTAKAARATATACKPATATAAVVAPAAIVTATTAGSVATSRDARPPIKMQASGTTPAAARPFVGPPAVTGSEI